MELSNKILSEITVHMKYARRVNTVVRHGKNWSLAI